MILYYHDDILAEVSRPYDKTERYNGKGMADSMVPESNSGGFPKTHWSVILSSRDPADRRRSLEYLFKLYRPVLYSYFRSVTNISQTGCEDLVQDFWLYLMEHNLLSVADPERGRFRTFLRYVAKNFWRDRVRHELAQKRGGNVKRVSLDVDAEEPTWTPPASGENPEEAYDRAWANQVIGRTLSEMEAKLRAMSKTNVMEAFRLYHLGQEDLTQEEISRRLGGTTPQVKRMLMEARRVFTETIEAVVTESVENLSEVRDEVQYLLDRCDFGGTSD
jgi:RNA polymerase sigma-70 factor (ECF subfamily)